MKKTTSKPGYSTPAENEAVLFRQLKESAGEAEAPERGSPEKFPGEKEIIPGGTGLAPGSEAPEELNQENEIRLIKSSGIAVPEEKVFGAGYFTLRALGVTPIAAYKIIESDLKRTEADLLIPPPRAGRVNSKTTEPKSFYTPEEVDRLTETDLKDPKILEDVMNSMTKWNQ